MRDLAPTLRSLDRLLSAAQQQQIRDLAPEALIDLHFSLGTW